jgi:hypothetical protein
MTAVFSPKQRRFATAAQPNGDFKSPLLDDPLNLSPPHF